MLDLVTKEQLPEILQSNKKVIIKFGADWCSGCKALAPYLDRLQKDHPEVKFLEVDADEESELVAQYNVKNLPTLISFVDGTKSDTLTGSGLGMKVLKDFVLKA